MKKGIKGLIVITVNLIILVVIGMIWLFSIKSQRIQNPISLQIQIHVESSGEQLLKKTDVSNLISKFYKKDIRKIPVYNLNLKNLEDFLISQPLVKKADIYLDGKNVLHADIYQRSPLIRIIDISGNQYFLDQEGFKIPVSNAYSSRVLVATGQLSEITGKQLHAKEKLFYKGLIFIAKTIRADTFVNALVEQIHIDNNGEYTLIPKVGNEKIFLGGPDMLHDKLDRLKLFYRENMGRQGWNVYQVVNLKYKAQIIGKRIHQES